MQESSRSGTDTDMAVGEERGDTTEEPARNDGEDVARREEVDSARLYSPELPISPGQDTMKLGPVR